jgi:hypothetical protein
MPLRVNPFSRRSMRALLQAMIVHAWSAGCSGMRAVWPGSAGSSQMLQRHFSLDAQRRTEKVLAVNEALTNTVESGCSVRDGQGTGSVRGGLQI